MQGMSGEFTILFSILFGALGFGYILYGRRNDAPVAFAAGIGLVAAPYVVSNALLLVAAGLALAFTPYWLRG